LDAGGREVLALRPTVDLQQVAVSRLAEQGPLIDKALAEHRRWASGCTGLWCRRRAHAVSELAGLEAIKRAVGTARESWRQPPPRSRGRPAARLGPPALPGRLPGAGRFRRRGADADAHPSRRHLGAAAGRSSRPATEVDRFLFRVLHRRLTEGRDQSLAGPISRWVQAHGAELGVKPGTGS
jgi:hypothetical protein